MRNKETKLKNKVTRKWQRDQEEFEYFVHDPSYMEHQAMTHDDKLKGHEEVTDELLKTFILLAIRQRFEPKLKNGRYGMLQSDLYWIQRGKERGKRFIFVLLPKTEKQIRDCSEKGHSYLHQLFKE